MKDISLSKLSSEKIFDIVRHLGPLSPSDLIARAGLSRSACYSHLSQLQSRKMIRYVSPTHKRGRLQLIKVNEDFGRILGVDLGATSLDLGICDIDPKILRKKTIEIKAAAGPEKILRAIYKAADELLESLGLSRNSLLGIGMGIPGLVEFSSGMVVSPTLMSGWNQFPIRDILQEKYSCPTFVDNDCNIAALGEKRNGVGRHFQDCIFVKIGTGIGSGIIINGSIYRGSKGCAGDIGHVKVPSFDIPCPCGNSGCLEMVAAAPAMIRLAQNAVRNSQCNILKEILKKGEVESTVEIGIAADRGDIDCLKIIQQSGQLIGEVLAMIANFINPSAILIGGGLSNLGDKFISSISKTIHSRALALATKDLIIRKAVLGPEAGIMGASHLVMDQLFLDTNIQRESLRHHARRAHE